MCTLKCHHDVSKIFICSINGLRGVVNYSSHSKNIKQIAANTPNLLRTNWKELTIEAQVGCGKIPPSPKRPQGYH